MKGKPSSAKLETKRSAEGQTRTLLTHNKMYLLVNCEFIMKLIFVEVKYRRQYCLDDFRPHIVRILFGMWSLQSWPACQGRPESGRKVEKGANLLGGLLLLLLLLLGV